jgi:small subunit ribosomal protein S4
LKVLVEQDERKTIASWLELHLTVFAGKVVRVPARNEINAPIQE